MQNYIDEEQPEKSTEEIDRLYNDIFYPIHLGNFFGISQLIQSTGFLIGFIYERPDVLIEIVKVSQKKPQCFQRLIRSTIPSLFGYFSTYDHIEYAFKFYRLVIQECDFKLSGLILKNFFSGPFMFRYVESFMSQFVKEFGVFLYTNSSFEIEEIQDFFADKLRTLLVASSSLIITQHILILQNLKDLKWDPKAIWHLFWTRSCLPIIEMYLSTSIIAPFKNVYDGILKKVHNTRYDLIDKILKKSTGYSLPSIDSSTNVTGMQLYVCLGEIIDLIECLELTDMKPDVLSKEEFENFTEEVKIAHYWCVVYPRKSMSRTSSKNSMSGTKLDLFDDTKYEFLYPYILEKLKEKNIENWRNTLTTNLNLWFHNVIGIVLHQHEFKNSHLFQDTYLYYTNKVKSSDQKKILFLKLLDLYYELKRQQNEILFWRLDKMWKDIIEKYSTQVQNFLDFSSKLSKSAEYLFFEALKLVRCLDSFTFMNRHDILIQIFLNIYNAGDGDHEFFVQFFLQSSSLTFLSSMILVGSLVMKNPFFVENCDSTEIQAWDAAESSWMKIIQSDPMVASTVQEFSIVLIRDFSTIVRKSVVQKLPISNPNPSVN